MVDDPDSPGRLDAFKERIGAHPLVTTAALRAYGMAQIPLIWYVRPSVVELSETRCVVRIPYRRRNKNHLGTMYLGVLGIGADVAGGVMAMRRIQQSGRRVDLLFKDMKAEFLKRIEGDAYFTCGDGQGIAAAVAKTVQSGERVNFPMEIVVTVPDRLGDEPAARFTLTLSLKGR